MLIRLLHFIAIALKRVTRAVLKTALAFLFPLSVNAYTQDDIYNSLNEIISIIPSHYQITEGNDHTQSILDYLTLDQSTFLQGFSDYLNTLVQSVDNISLNINLLQSIDEALRGITIFDYSQILSQIRSDLSNLKPYDYSTILNDIKDYQTSNNTLLGTIESSSKSIDSNVGSLVPPIGNIEAYTDSILGLIQNNIPAQVQYLLDIRDSVNSLASILSEFHSQYNNVSEQTLFHLQEQTYDIDDIKKILSGTFEGDSIFSEIKRQSDLTKDISDYQDRIIKAIQAIETKLNSSISVDIPEITGSFQADVDLSPVTDLITKTYNFLNDFSISYSEPLYKWSNFDDPSNLDEVPESSTETIDATDWHTMVNKLQLVQIHEQDKIVYSLMKIAHLLAPTNTEDYAKEMEDQVNDITKSSDVEDFEASNFTNDFQYASVVNYKDRLVSNLDFSNSPKSSSLPSSISFTIPSWRGIETQSLEIETAPWADICFAVRQICRFIYWSVLLFIIFIVFRFLSRCYFAITSFLTSSPSDTRHIG